MLLGHTHSFREVNLPSKALTKHTAIFGSTGSGKSGLLLGMVEELHREGIPVILVDIKGDMINIALQDQNMNVQCLTPGGNHGEAVNVLADLNDEDKATTVISAILSMVGEDSDPLRSRAHGYLSAILNTLGNPTLENIVEGCQDPDFSDLGAMTLDNAFPRKSRMVLARKLNTLLVSPSFRNWRLGMDLEVDEFIKSDGITVYSVAHLIDQNEQSFAISFLLNEVLRWTKQQRGSNELRLALIIDECVGLMPPYPANPPTKEPLMLLLKQARAFGIGLLLATQNPVDIDYKAMSNCNTWLVGRMTAKRDRDRVVSGMVSAGLGDAEDLNRVIAGLKSRHFAMATMEGGHVFKSKTVACDLRGPMIPSEVMEMYEEGHLTYNNSFDRELCAARARVGLDNSDPGMSVDSMNDNDDSEEPNVTETTVGLCILASSAYCVIQLFEFLAKYLKGIL